MSAEWITLDKELFARAERMLYGIPGGAKKPQPALLTVQLLRPGSRLLMACVRITISAPGMCVKPLRYPGKTKPHDCGDQFTGCPHPTLQV